MTNITPDRHRELIFSYFNNAKRFEKAGISIKCCRCGIVTPKLDYIKNYGYCDSCRPYLDEQHKRDLEQYQDDMKYLRDNGLI